MGTHSFAHTSSILPLTVKLPFRKVMPVAVPSETHFSTILQHWGYLSRPTREVKNNDDFFVFAFRD